MMSNNKFNLSMKRNGKSRSLYLLVNVSKKVQAMPIRTLFICKRMKITKMLLVILFSINQRPKASLNL